MPPGARARKPATSGSWRPEVRAILQPRRANVPCADGQVSFLSRPTRPVAVACTHGSTMPELRSFLSHCGTVAVAGLLVGGMALLGAVPAGLGALDILSSTPASAAAAAGSQNSVSGYGAAFAAVGNQSGLGGPLVAIASTPDGNGYWTTSASGQVASEGDAQNFGSVTTALRAPIVGMTATQRRGRLLVGGGRRRCVHLR